MRLLDLGHGSVVPAEDVMAVLPARSSPVRRSVKEATAAQRLMDVTAGRKQQTVLVLRNGLLVLCALTPETVRLRLARSGRGRPRKEMP